MVMFPVIARFTKRLSIFLGSLASHESGDDVIELQVLRGFTPFALIFEPILAIRDIEFGAPITSADAKLNGLRGGSVGENHFVSMIAPQAQSCLANLLDLFRRVFVPFGVLIAKTFSLTGLTHFLDGFGRMLPAKEMVIGSTIISHDDLLWYAVKTG